MDNNHLPASGPGLIRLHLLQLRLLRVRWLLALWLAGGLGLFLTAPLLASEAAPTQVPLRTTPAVSAPQMVVVRVYFADDDMLNELAHVLDVWEVHHSASADDRYVVAMMAQIQVDALRRARLRVERDEVRSAEIARQPLVDVTQTSGIPGYSCYRTLEETYATFEALATAHPQLVEWIDIGDSWNKLNPGNGAGHDLNVAVLTNQAIPGPKPRFFLMAAIHAREFTPAETATRFAEQLVNGYGSDPDATWLLDYTEIHILAQANPDGRKWAEQLLYWRKNTNRDGCAFEDPFFNYYGVDLNRNSSFKWGQCEGAGCSTSSVCLDTYRGPSAASEPETQAIQAYIAGLYPDRRGPNDEDAAPSDTSGILISLHSYSQLVLFPWGWRSTPSPNHDELQTLGSKFGYYTQYEACQSGAPGCIYMTDGTTDDWAYGELGIAAYTFELGTTFFQQCSYFEETILPNTLPALRYAAKAAWRPYQLPAGPENVQVVVTPTRILSGTVVTLTAQANDTLSDSHNSVPEVSQAIATAHYSLDTPSWITGTQQYAMTATDGTFDDTVEAVKATVDTSGWLPGRRLLLVESQDADGNWGVPSGVFIDVLASANGVMLAPDALTTTVSADKIVTITLTVTNTGLVSDSFGVEITGTQWAVDYADIGPLAPLHAAPLTLRVTVPATATLGASETILVTVHSQTDADAQTSSNITLTVAAPTDMEESEEPKRNEIFLPVIGG